MRRIAAASPQAVKGLGVVNVRVAFVTHLHSDHTAGYADLILTPWSVGRSHALEVYGPKGIKHMTDHILEAYREDIETLRYDMQHARLAALRASGRMKPRLTMADARRIMWMYTGREVYRMLVDVAGWSADKYQDWLATTLVEALVDKPARR